MSAVNVTNVTVLDNPSMSLNAFQFEISYECLVPLNDGISTFGLKPEVKRILGFPLILECIEHLLLGIRDGEVDCSFDSTLASVLQCGSRERAQPSRDLREAGSMGTWQSIFGSARELDLNK